jgi:hypothetical protein
MYRKICCVGALALLLGGCGDDSEAVPQPQPTVIGEELNQDAMCGLMVGVSTPADVTGLFGAAELSGDANGRWLLQYAHIDERGVLQESTLFWFDGAQLLTAIDRVNKPLPACLQAR